MLKTIALLGLGAAVAFTSLPAIAQTNQSAAPAASAKASRWLAQKPGAASGQHEQGEGQNLG